MRRLLPDPLVLSLAEDHFLKLQILASQRLHFPLVVNPVLLHVELRRRLARFELVTLLVRGGYLPLKRGIVGIRRVVFIRPSLHLGGVVQVPPELLQLGSDPRQVSYSLLHRARRSEAVLVDTHGTRRRDAFRGQAQYPRGGERHLRRGFHAHARGTKGLERRCRDASKPTRRVL